ncbi:DUF418 domain-containing protein [Bacillus sp. SH5-2]|uniref:DUF418 domain-containing protein n=1 Tax=Bacillus sp. SH5-2 TaxID=2217834 RepID=UPI0011EDF346|nr:DUF418 domain-containing protein [Bacillus sp. SH5-2]KAA0764086.1 DUF418 domain-containing protein [Bacillus sp. SH5-2]
MKTEINSNRIDILDYLRGFGLIGILLVNAPFLLKMDPPPLGPIDTSYQRFLYLFIEGRFYTIFTFLFGIGFYIFIARAKAKGSNEYLLFIRRLILLSIMGYILSIFFSGEILGLYARWGIFLLPFYKVRRQFNLVFALLGILCLSFLGSKDLLVFPLFLLGLAVGQYCVFEKILENIRGFKVFTVIMAGLSLIGLVIHYISFNHGTRVSGTSYRIGLMIGPIISACYVGALVLLLQSVWVQKLLCPLKHYGRMALTNYVCQVALVLIADYYFQLTGNITYLQTFFLCIGIYVFQLLASTAWLQFFRMGPLEWLWRTFTYWKLISNKK